MNWWLLAGAASHFYSSVDMLTANLLAIVCAFTEADMALVAKSYGWYALMKNHVRLYLEAMSWLYSRQSFPTSRLQQGEGASSYQ